MKNFVSALFLLCGASSAFASSYNYQPPGFQPTQPGFQQPGFQQPTGNLEARIFALEQRINSLEQRVMQQGPGSGMPCPPQQQLHSCFLQTMGRTFTAAHFNQSMAKMEVIKECAKAGLPNMFCDIKDVKCDM